MNPTEMINCRHRRNINALHACAAYISPKRHLKSLTLYTPALALMNFVPAQLQIQISSSNPLTGSSKHQLSSLQQYVDTCWSKWGGGQL